MFSEDFSFFLEMYTFVSLSSERFCSSSLVFFLILMSDFFGGKMQFLTYFLCRIKVFIKARSKACSFLCIQDTISWGGKKIGMQDSTTASETVYGA